MAFLTDAEVMQNTGDSRGLRDEFGRPFERVREYLLIWLSDFEAEQLRSGDAGRDLHVTGRY